MFSLNRVELIGYTGAEPKTVANGPTTVTLATNSTWTDKAGTRQERTEWHTLVVWSALGKYAATLPKGTPVWAEGELIYEKFPRKVEAQQGKEAVEVEVTVTAAKIRVTRMIRLDNGQGREPEDQP